MTDQVRPPVRECRTCLDVRRQLASLIARIEDEHGLRPLNPERKETGAKTRTR